MVVPTVRSHDADRNLLFGVLALQNALIDNDQFAEACAVWATRKGTPLAALLLERGWLTPVERTEIERVVERKLKRHSGDPSASLAASTGDEIRRVLGMLDDPEIGRSVALHEGRSQLHLSTVHANAETRAHYTLTRLHAKGGIGQVWQARDSDLGRDVALKELRPERADSPALLTRFLDEAKITGQLEHPGIVPIYELARRPESKQPFYTMRFVRGRTLSEAVEAYHAQRQLGTAGPLEFVGLLNAFVNVCNAIAYAHARGVVHRDLKGHNVVLGDFGEVIVLDWGLAKVMERGVGGSSAQDPVVNDPIELTSVDGRPPTIAGQVLGTPAYMAPEQAEGRLDLVDERSDIYGLGAILYEILTGRPPFVGDVTDEVLRRVIDEAPARPRSLNPGAAPALEAVCLKALAKKPNDRYASASALAGDVQRCLADEPVDCCRESVMTRLGRWARRRRTLVVSGGVALLVAALMLFATVIVVTSLNRRLEALLAQMSEADSATQVVMNELLCDEFVPSATMDPKSLAARLADMTERIERRYEGQPALQSAALNFVANGYGRLHADTGDAALAERAKRLYETTLEIRRSAHGASHPATLQSVNNLWLAPPQDWDVAEAALRSNLAVCRRVLGPAHSLTLTAHHNWAWALYKQGKVDAAEIEWAKCLDERERHQGKDYPETMWTRHRLSSARVVLGRPRDVLGDVRAYWQYTNQCMGALHGKTLAAGILLAEVEWKNGNFKAARNVLEKLSAAHEQAPFPCLTSQTTIQRAFTELREVEGKRAGAERQ